MSAIRKHFKGTSSAPSRSAGGRGATTKETQEDLEGEETPSVPIGYGRCSNHCDIMAMRKSFKRTLLAPTGLAGGGGGTTGGHLRDSGGEVTLSVPTGYGGSSNYCDNYCN
jgi:hypothetical protein